jgi:hypothetical protein
MKQEQILLGIGLVVVAGFVASKYLPKFTGTEITPESLKLGLGLPVIWLFYNDSDVNSRIWYDFGTRQSRVINIPVLNTFYKTIVDKNKDKYRVEVIGGLNGVAEIMGGYDKLPMTLQNPKARITQPEEDWIRAAVLAKYGGLWLSPSVISLKGFGDLPKDSIVAYGQDTTPMYGSPVPGFRALWSPQAEHPVFVEWEKRCRERLTYQLGGRQVRGDAKSDWVDLTNGYKVDIRYKEELGRDPRTNKTLDLEDLLAAGTEGRIPFAVPESAVYVPFPYEDMLNRRHFGWILRSSEDQIMSSDIVLRFLLEQSSKLN